MRVLPFRMPSLPVVDAEATARAIDQIERATKRRIRAWRLRRALWHRVGLGLALGTTVALASAWAIFSVLFYVALSRWLQ